MRLLARCAALLCVWVSVSGQQIDIKDVFKKINEELLTGTYTARVEVTRGIKDQVKPEKTYTITEYHDGDNGLHSIETVPLNTKKYLYKRGSAAQVASVDATGKCDLKSAKDAAAEPESFIYELATDKSSEYFLGPTAAVIGISSESIDWIPMDDVVRGIKAKLYTSKQKDEKSKKEVQVWFADGWKFRTMSEKNIPFPIRILLTDGDFSDQFDFYQVEDLSPKQAFRLSGHLQLPFGAAGCEALQWNLQPPLLLDTFSFSSVVEGSIGAKEYFSQSDRLYRADTPEGTVIHDDNHGLIYKLGSGCEVTPNPKVHTAIISVGSENFGASVIQAYLRLQKKIYVGESFVRGIPVDVWDAVPDNDADPDVKRARFFFSKPLAVKSANGMEGTQQLVKAWLLESATHADTFDVDIYDFAQSATTFDSKSIFNIEDCAQASTYVEIELQADKTFNIDDFKLSNAEHELLQKIEYFIKLSTAVSPLQLGAAKAEVVDGNTITVYSRIFAPAPYLSSFTTRKKANSQDVRVFKHYIGKQKQVRDEEECAKRCITSDAKCPTFLFCGKSTCQLMEDSDETKWGDPSSIEDCYAYDHVPATDHIERFTLQNITDVLEKAVLTLWGPIKVSIGDKQFVTLRAKTFVDHLSQFNQEGTLGPYMFQYKGYSIRDEHASSEVAGGQIDTVGQCYRECRTNKKLACSSFSLCTSIKHCVLSSANINAGPTNDIDQNEAIQKTTADCSIYSVNYLTEFEKLEGRKRKSGELESSAAATAGDCAVKCRQGKMDVVTECRSFTFCPEPTGNRCYFYDTHYNWDGGDDALESNKTCDHYALRFSASYTAIGKGRFPSKPNNLVKSISFDACAKQCSEESNGACKTISYCDSEVPNKPKMECYMYTDDIIDLRDSNDGETTCTIYTQLLALNDDVINPKNQMEKEGQGIQRGMGDGAFACLLIAMIAVGAILGAVGWYQRDKVNALIGRGGESGGSGTTISYSRQEEDSRTEASSLP